MRDLYNFQIGSRAAIYRLYRYSTPVGALLFRSGIALPSLLPSLRPPIACSNVKRYLDG